jgi:hypothetical protein
LQHDYSSTRVSSRQETAAWVAYFTSPWPQKQNKELSNFSIALTRAAHMQKDEGGVKTNKWHVDTILNAVNE